MLPASVIVLTTKGSGLVEAVGRNVKKLVPGGPCRDIAFWGERPLCIGGHPACCGQWVPLTFSGGRQGEGGLLHDGAEEMHGRFFGRSSSANYASSDQSNAIQCVLMDAPPELLGVPGCGVKTGAMNIGSTTVGGTFPLIADSPG